MTNAKKDGNYASTMIGTLNTDGSTITPVQAVPSTHALKIDDNTTGSDNGPTRALRDENSVTTLMAVSSADGVTPVPLYVDSDGKLLVNSL